MVQIVQKGNSILRKKAEEVPLDSIASKKIKDLIAKMKKAILETEEAVAVAAPQLGQSLKIFVISEYVLSPTREKQKKDFGYLVFINPKILKKSKKQKVLTEGCLSVPHIYGVVKRAEKIKVEAFDENGRKFIKSGGGLFSQVIQHEMDHLEGILFIDKAIKLVKYEERKTSQKI